MITKKEQAAWLKREVETVRVDTMQDAIEGLSKKSFFVVAINADNINCDGILVFGIILYDALRKRFFKNVQV